MDLRKSLVQIKHRSRKREMNTSSKEYGRGHGAQEAGDGAHSDANGRGSNTRSDAGVWTDGRDKTRPPWSHGVGLMDETNSATMGCRGLQWRNYMIHSFFHHAK